MAKRPLWRLLSRALDRFWGLDEIDFTISDDPLGVSRLPGETPLEQAAYALSQASRVLVFAGSGLSAESGVATFRGADEGGSLYDDEAVRQATNAQTFTTDPDQQLAWHQAWREVIRGAQPHEGLRALARVLARFEHALLVTQNVDDLMERAAEEVGVELEILHAHGTLERVRCHTPEGHARDLAPGERLDALPDCEVCGARMRPDVVWFGEPLDPDLVARALDAARRCDVCLIVGTSGLVHPAAALPGAARQGGARVVEINPNPTHLSELCDARVEQGARDALMGLERAFEALGSKD